MTADLYIALREPLAHPVRVVEVDGFPKVFAAGAPVTPINVVLKRLREVKGATPDGLGPYVRASRLYCEFCAHLNRSITEVSNAEFFRFHDALLGLPFMGAGGSHVIMRGERERGKRTADLMLSCIYTVAGQIEELYGVRFDWRRYGNLSNEVVDLIRAVGGRKGVSLPRTHSIKFTPRKVPALPDDQFIKLIQGARKLWIDVIPDGDAAFSDDPPAQRGALYYRNVGLLFVLRYVGARRREPVFIEFGDIRRAEATIHLVTKGYGGESGKRLPVILFPFVDEIIWHYATLFRPDTGRTSSETQRRVFLSHSVRNYAEPITPQTVRKLIERLRVALDPPWDKILTPHMLRHAFGYQLQRMAGISAQKVNMRHASYSSGDAYRAGVENYIDEMIGPLNDEVTLMLAHAGLTELLKRGLSDDTES